jgi:hypothetical protein
MAGITTGLAITPNAIVDGIRHQLMPEMMLHLNRTLSEAHSSVVNLFKPNETFPQSTARTHRQINPRETHPHLLKRLRDFMGSATGLMGFTSAIQSEVTQLMYDGDRNIGYFAATGRVSIHRYSVKRWLMAPSRIWENYSWAGQCKIL